MKNVKLTHVQAGQIWVAEHTRSGERVIPPLPRLTEGATCTERLLHTGAKLYRNTRGFFLGGYAADGSDVDRVLLEAGI